MNKNIRVQNKDKSQLAPIPQIAKSLYKLQSTHFSNFDTYIPPRPKLNIK